MTRKDGTPSSKLRKAWTEGLEILPPSEKDVRSVFDGWAEWAGSRHFMVFKGHYLSWIRAHFSGGRDTRLLGFYREGKPIGVLGYETYNGTRVVVLAKHLPELKPNVLWAKGLLDAGDGVVLCGSTADDFKSRFGMYQRESWTFKLGK